MTHGPFDNLRANGTKDSHPFVVSPSNHGWTKDSVVPSFDKLKANAPM